MAFYYWYHLTNTSENTFATLRCIFVHCIDRAYYDVTDLDAKTALSNTTANCLILIWPPYNDPMAHEALIIFQKKANSTSRIIYWGEEMGGCTTNDAFY